MATSFHSFMDTSSHSSSSSSCLSSSFSSSSVIHVCPHLALGFGSCSCKSQGNKRKRGHQETKKNNNVSSSLLLDMSLYPKTVVCLHLSLSVCTCLDETQIVKKQKRVQQETNVSTMNNTCNALAVGTHSDCSTNAGDPWMIKKVLTSSDLDDNSRLLLNKDLAKKWVVPVLDKAKAENEGVEVEVFDVDTRFPLSLTFKIRPSNDSHVFNNTWITDFVERRDLKKGDEIGLKWNEEKKRFDFSVLHRS